MLTSSPIPKQTVGRTFFYAIIVLGVVALIQVGAVSWAFIKRFHTTPRDTSIALRGMPTPGPDEPALKFPETQPLGNESPATSLPAPTPIPEGQIHPGLSPAQGRLNDLIDQARALSDRGDMNTALIRLHEALAQAPNDPRVLSEIALAYEKLGTADKAMDYWQQIENLGKDAAGSYYDMAMARLSPPDIGTESTTGSSKYDSEGFLPGSDMALVDITKTDSSDTPGKKFSLRVPVKSRPGTHIDVQDVSLYVIIKDRLDDGSIVRTTANVTNGWITSPPNWNQNNIQILQVGYSAASLDSDAGKAEKRTYYGYIALIYYKGKLQDARAEPASLLTQFPPPPSPPNEDEQ